MNNSEIGKSGENIAHDFLVEKGYVILDKNWRFGRLEVDIIATYKSMLIIVEVKTRSYTDFGYPDEAVDYRKIDFLAEAAAAYQEEKNIDLETRFDIISIVIQNNQVKILHLEEAFHP